MKPGSLISTNYPQEGFIRDAANGGYAFIPQAPHPNGLYTAKAIYPHPDNPNWIVLEVEEFHVVATNGRPYAVLNAAYWYEVQPPMDLTELLEETKHSQLKIHA